MRIYLSKSTSWIPIQILYRLRYAMSFTIILRITQYKTSHINDPSHWAWAACVLNFEKFSIAFGRKRDSKARYWLTAGSMLSGKHGFKPRTDHQHFDIPSEISGFPVQMVSFTSRYVGFIGGWVRAHFTKLRLVIDHTLIPRYATLYCTLRYIKLHYIGLLR